MFPLVESSCLIINKIIDIHVGESTVYSNLLKKGNCQLPPQDILLEQLNFLHDMYII